jgi:hypothetical protein
MTEVSPDRILAICEVIPARFPGECPGDEDGSQTVDRVAALRRGAKREGTAGGAGNTRTGRWEPWKSG